MNLTDVLIFLGVGIVVFLIFREIVMWYWKINEIVSNQRVTNELLEEQNELLEANNEILSQFVEDFMKK
ncbi:hypothetical protein [Parapedobacter koreensis]|uniref:Uncharacterized protein n=1 Tax=Parapedobacter koreensis TaxID=332977 RepID=A0A1H7QBN9_9SPHI|nr:hypothetical protein [Parapedobacter koreensis]SEL44697.1 hypothetical protein SAMN05421740_105253 [Parapedobacter koreensis]